jgi:hypothetical protein
MAMSSGSRINHLVELFAYCFERDIFGLFIVR